MRNEIFNGFYDKLNVKTRPGRGGNYSYVTADDVTDRMNKLFKGNWSTMVTFQGVEGGNVIVRVRVEVTNPEDGNLYSHEGYGGQKEDPAAEAGNVFKSAYSKAIVSACRRWGVGLYLEEEAQASSAGVPGPFSAPTVAVPTPQAEKPAEVKPEPVLNVPIPQKVSAGIEIKQEVPKEETPSMPKIPVPIPGVKAPVQSSAEPINVPGVLATDEVTEEGMVNDVQKISIESLIKMRGVPYNEMAKGALGRIPNVNTLSHTEAIAVIRHGNALYNKDKHE